MQWHNSLANRPDFDHGHAIGGVTRALGSQQFPCLRRAAQELTLKLPERIGHLCERGTVAQGSGLALDPSQIMPPVIDRSSAVLVGSIDDPAVLA